MASTPDNLYVTYVDFDRELLKIWGQRNRIAATYIERRLLQLLPEFNKASCPSSILIQKGTFCFAKYTDDNYYRARVISRVQGDSVGVLFVDYGNRDVIKLSNIRIQEGNEGDVLTKMSEQAEEYYLARIAAPPSGWTRDILGEIRRYICYDEFHYQVVDQIGDQKILDIRFRDEDFSNYLVKKQLAKPLPLPVQRELILSYCSLVSNDMKREDIFRDTLPRLPFSPSQPPPGLRGPLKPANVTNDINMQLNYAKASPINFPCPPPPVHYPPPRHLKTPFHQLDQNIPKNSFYPNHINNQMLIDPVPVQPLNPNFNPLLNQQFNQLYQMQESADSLINNNSIHKNNNIIELLAQQVKQYIAKDNAKTDTVEQVPHHYINSVLEVGNTYNVIISYIDDGPWSFSIQLLSSEVELQKLMDELSTVELVPIKPPFILGHPCIGSSQLYGNLCRGVVMSISRTAVKVYFVDFGNTEDLPASSIYELPPRFFKIRVLSQKFSLSGLQKVAYSDDIKKFFKEVVQDGLLVLRVTSLEDDNLPTCELYIKERNIKRILNEKMRELKNSVMEDLPKVGETENVLVTWVVSPQKFFVQLCKRDGDLNALKKELEEVSTKGQTMTYQQLSVGFKCICLYESDGNWYRAVITSVDSENAISVFYIDYGNTETVNISRLRKVDGSGLVNQMGNQAVQCSLKGFENQPYDAELSKKLEGLILEKEFQMSVSSSEHQLLCVNLSSNGNDVASLLLMQLQQKGKDLETSSFSGGSVWDSPETAKASMPNGSGNKFQVEESYERRDRNFHGDQTRKKSRAGRRTNIFQSFQSPPQASVKNRFEDRENKRDNKSSFRDASGWGEQKFDQQKSWRSRGPKESKDWDSDKFAGSRGPPKGRGQSYERGGIEKGRGFGRDGRNGIGREGERGGNYGDKKFGGSRNRFDGTKKYEDREGKRFESSRGWDSVRGGEDSRKKLSDRFEKLDEKKTSRLSVKKEDIAPPGSKFEEKVIEMGSCEKGIVTYYFSPDEFFVQLLAEEEEFKKMMKAIQFFYSDKYTMKDPVKAGDLVIAQFSHDKILYRAEVIKPSPVTVRYVDYGNQEPVQSRGIWPVDKQFLKLPQQVIKCRLSGLQPIGSDWPPPGSATDKFFEFAEYRCTFLGKQGDFYEISMEAVENGKDIASEIIAAGLGRPLDLELDIPETDYSLLRDQILRLFVSHVESSSKFYVVINPRASELIAEALSNIRHSKRSLCPIDWSKYEPGMPCLATTDNVSWHRGNITNTCGNNVSVWLSDRGDSVLVPRDKVMQAPAYLKAVQPQAVECCLHGISLADDEDEENFKKAVEHKRPLVHIVSAADKRLSVILYDEEGTLFEFEKDCDAARKVDPIGQLPVIGQQLPLVVSQLESAKEIYIQRIGDESNLISFLEQINNFYAEGGEDFQEDEDIPENTFVMAKSIVYDCWYRGRLLSWATSNVDSEVFYVDYGNREFLPRGNIKKLDSSFMDANAFCRSVAFEENFESAEFKEKFWEVCENKDLVGCFRNRGGELTVEILANGEKVTDLLKLARLSPVDESNRFLDSQSVDPKVFVSHIDSPGCFWVHKDTTVNELQQFQRMIQKSCENAPEKRDAKENDMIAAAFSGMWYRAKVVETEDRSLKVQFVDYGNTAIVDLNSEVVKELAADLVKVPSFATLFALKGIWSENSTSKFTEIILRNEDPLRVVVLEEGEPVVVDLFQNGKSITEMLEEELEERDSDLCTVYITHSNSPQDFYLQRESSMAALNRLTERLLDADNFETPASIRKSELYAARYPEDGAWYRARVISSGGGETVVHFVDYGNTSPVTEMKRLPSDLVHVPNLAENCCLIYGNNCDSWSEAACVLFSEYADGRALQMKVILAGAKRTIVRLFHGNKCVSEELEAVCEKDGRTEMYVSHAMSPTDLYVHYVYDEEYKLIEEILRKEGRECEDLEDRELGALCHACFADDGCWYRAKILRDLGEGGCEVFFIDFGNTGISKELKKLPPSIENIPPRAYRCSLDLPGTDITKSMREEFINLTAAGAAVFRGRFVIPGETNLISLKLDGRILEETLDVMTEECSSDAEKSPKSLTSEDVSDEGTGSCKANGDKSMEEIPEEEVEEAETSVEEIPREEETVEGTTEKVPKQTLKRKGGVLGVGGVRAAREKKNMSSKINKAVPASICRGEKEAGVKETSLYRKSKFSERVVPGSISRGISLESMADGTSTTTEEEYISQSAPNTPRPLRRSEYMKMDLNDRVVPGCISTGIPLHCSPLGEKTLQSEKIVPGAVNGNH